MTIGGSVTSFTVGGTLSDNVTINHDLDSFSAGTFTKTFIAERVIGQFDLVDGAHTKDKIYATHTQVIYNGVSDILTANAAGNVAPTAKVGLDQLRYEASVVTLDLAALSPRAAGP